MFEGSKRQIVLDVLEVLPTKDFKAFGLVLLADWLIFSFQQLLVAQGSDVQPSDAWQDGGKTTESDSISKENVHSIYVLVAQIKHPFHFLCQLLHDRAASTIRVALGSNEDGIFEPVRWLPRVATDFLSDLMHSTLLFHDEQCLTSRFDSFQCPEAAHMRDQMALASQLGVVYVQRQCTQQETATGANDPHVLSFQSCIEGEQFYVIIHQRIVAVVVNKLVVEIPLGDELLLLQQGTYYFHYLQQSSHCADGSQTHNHAALPTQLIGQGGEVKPFGVGMQWQLEGLADDALPDLIFQQGQSVCWCGGGGCFHEYQNECG